MLADDRFAVRLSFIMKDILKAKLIQLPRNGSLGKALIICSC